MKMKNTQKSYRLSLGRRITAALMTFVMMAQVCIPGIAAAAILVSDDQITSEMMSNYQFQPSSSRDYLYEQAAYFNQVAPIQNKTIANFHKDLVAAKAGLPKPTYVPIAGNITVILPVHRLDKVIGDAYVQNRYIRSQITDLLGRHMIDTAAYSTELSQINALYANALTFAKTNTSGYVFGKKIAQDFVISQDMIWPELRAINGQQVLVPIVYLTDNTLNTRGVKDHTIEFAGTSAQFANIILDKTTLLARRNAFIQTVGDIVNAGGTISGQQNLTLAVGGTLKNISGNISADQNLSIIAGQIYSKTQVHPFTDKNGSGTRLGEVAGFDSATGSISLESYNDIIFEGANATANNGSISFNAANNIVIQGVSTQYQGTGREGDWRINKSSVDIFQSRLNAQETISLIAGGSITITASELISTQGGIELLAKQGIYVLNEFGQTYVQKEDKKGKTRGTASDFETWAIRSVLNAGRGVLIHSDEGDITLTGTKINSVDGTNVTAKNGKVHLLVAKEQSQHYLNTVRKGTWTIKTVSEEYIEDTGVPNAIIGGFAVEALHGVEVEYTGKEGATLAEQIREYEKMPEMAWMATLHKDPTVQANWEQVELEYKRLRETNTSLSPAAMAIIAIAVAVAMGPAGLQIVGSGGPLATVAGSSTLGAAVSAGAVTLTTQAVSSLAAGNNLNETLEQMSSSESLKSLAISMATAGAMNYAQLDKISMFKDAAANANPLISLSAQAAQVVVDATVSAGVSVAISGGNFDQFKSDFVKSLAMSSVTKIGQELASKIGAASKLPAPQNIDTATKYFLHAGLGCLSGVATSQINDLDDKSIGCTSGAGGAVIGEYVGTLYADKTEAELKEWIKENTDIASGKMPSPEEFVAKYEYFTAKGVDLAKLSAALVAYAAQGNVGIAASAGENAAKFNALSKNEPPELTFARFITMLLREDAIKALAHIGAGTDPISVAIKDVTKPITDKLTIQTPESIKPLVQVLLVLSDYMGDGVELMLETHTGQKLTKQWSELKSQFSDEEILAMVGAGKIVSLAMTFAPIEKLRYFKNIADTSQSKDINFNDLIKDKNSPEWNKLDINEKLILNPASISLSELHDQLTKGEIWMSHRIKAEHLDANGNIPTSNNGVLGEKISIEVMQSITGRNFRSIQNSSGHGPDGIFIDPETETIYIIEVKSSINGVDAAARPAGTAYDRLNEWNTKMNTGQFGKINQETFELMTSLGNAWDNQYSVKGMWVKVEVPPMGSTSINGVELKLNAW